MRCPHCDETVETNTHHPSFVIFCPGCGKICQSVSEYGYGIVYPIGFYLGYRLVGEVIQIGKYPNTSYVLHRFGMDDLQLEDTDYLSVIKKTKTIMNQWLNGN